MSTIYNSINDLPEWLIDEYQNNSLVYSIVNFLNQVPGLYSVEELVKIICKTALKINADYLKLLMEHACNAVPDKQIIK